MMNGFLGLSSLLSQPRTNMSALGSTPPTEVLELRHRLDTLELACAGLWELLKTRHGYTDEDLVKIIEEVDARDGSKDGKVTATVQDCPHCGRRLLTKRRDKCVWCGADLAPSPL